MNVRDLKQNDNCGRGLHKKRLWSTRMGVNTWRWLHFWSDGTWGRGIGNQPGVFWVRHVGWDVNWTCYKMNELTYFIISEIHFDLSMTNSSSVKQLSNIFLLHANMLHTCLIAFSVFLLLENTNYIWVPQWQLRSLHILTTHEVCFLLGFKWIFFDGTF